MIYDTSAEAYASVDTSRLEELVLSAIKSFGKNGCTSDDVRTMFRNFAYSSITARYAGLYRKKLITYLPEKRKGVSGRNMRVMVAA